MKLNNSVVANLTDAGVQGSISSPATSFCIIPVFHVTQAQNKWLIPSNLQSLMSDFLGAGKSQEKWGINVIVLVSNWDM